MQRLAELMVEEERERGTFVSTPHLSHLERASRSLGQQLSRASLARATREVAALSAPTAACPTCGEPAVVRQEPRRVQGLDGPVEVLESVAHCPACRRDFFPSA